MDRRDNLPKSEHRVSLAFSTVCLACARVDSRAKAQEALLSLGALLATAAPVSLSRLLCGRSYLRAKIVHFQRQRLI